MSVRVLIIHHVGFAPKATGILRRREVTQSSISDIPDFTRSLRRHAQGRTVEHSTPAPWRPCC
jgi:hypothetical protein